MKQKLIKFFAILCIFVVAFQLMPLGVGARDINDVQQEIEDKKNHLKDLEARISANQANKAAYEAALLEYQESYEALVLLIDEQAVLIKLTGEDLDKKTDQLSDASERIRSNRELYIKRLRAIYEMNSTNAMLSTLLSVDNYGDFVQMSDAIGRISQRDTAVLQQLADERGVLEQTKLELESAIDALRLEMTQLQENRQWALDKMEEMKKLITDATWQISQTQIESEATEEEIKALQAEYARIFAELQQKGSKTGDGSVRYGGPLVWPVAGYSRVSSWYGDPRSNTRGHYGIDIPAPTGTPIVAAASGTVITSEWHYSYGNYVVIDHGDGFRTLYAHCYQPGIAAGSYVVAGDTIAGVGNTGNSYGAHLHIEVHDGGSRQDPAGANYLGIY